LKTSGSESAHEQDEQRSPNKQITPGAISQGMPGATRFSAAGNSYLLIFSGPDEKRMNKYIPLQVHERFRNGKIVV
jgi:hypothetical protein